MDRKLCELDKNNDMLCNNKRALNTRLCLNVYKSSLDQSENLMRTEMAEWS